MPIFEYKCRGCNKAFEKLIFDKSTKIQCPYCNSENVEKQLSAFSSLNTKANINCSAHKACNVSGTHCCEGKCPLN